MTKKGKRYYITFIDDYSRWTHIEFLTQKSDVFEAYKCFEVWCETQFGTHIKILHSDRGGEYTGDDFQNHLKSRGTQIKLTVHDTPEHNGVAERRNRTILERVRALLHLSRLLKTLWAEAAMHVMWLMNRLTMKAIEGKTPFEAVYLKKPNLKGIREWGEKVWVHYGGGDKLGMRARKGRWLGRDVESNGSQILFPETGTIKIERNFRFIDKKLTDIELEGEQDVQEITQTLNKSEVPVVTPQQSDASTPSPNPSPKKEYQPVIQQEHPQ